MSISNSVNIIQKIKTFFKDNFSLTSTKKAKIVGSVVSFALLLFVVIQSETFIALNFASKWLLWAFALAAPLLIGVYIAFTVKIKNNIFYGIWYLLLMFILPLVTITMTECLNGVFIYDMTYLGFFGNYVVTLLFYFLFFAVSGSLRVSVIVVNSILFGLALAHCYIMVFRGTPFVPMDFLSVSTAVGVANTYDYSFTYTMIIGILLYIFIIVVGIKLSAPKFHMIVKIISRCFTGSFFAVVMIIFYFTSIFANLGVKPDFWNQTRGYRNYGFTLNFFCNTKYLYMSKPSDYNAYSVGDVVYNTIKDDQANSNINPNVSEKTPNIICIMNESLSDLKVLGDFTTNQEYMPFLNSLTENTIKGNLYVPVIGAGTSNTEFEFLTGHSTAFLPSGSNAYMLYVKNPLASIVSTLEGQGYSSWALHPYFARGWNRVSVYEKFGFDGFCSLENIIDTSVLEEYANNGSDANYLQSLVDTYYPDRSNMLVRQYVSDDYNYDLLINDFENRDTTKPYFSFNVTMQNHGGYNVSANNFTEDVYVTSTNIYYQKTNQYLSLVKRSDDAFKKLIEYFSNVDEPTVICMFGDHQPSIEPEFIASLLGVNSLSSLSIQQEQQRHITPFYIWANYDIEEKYIDKLSVNYLSSYVLDAAGVKLTNFNKYLLKLSESLPVIDTVGYIDNQGNYYKWSDASEYSEIISEYERVQYNNIFDPENTDNETFYLEGFEWPQKAEDTSEDEGT